MISTNVSVSEFRRRVLSFLDDDDPYPFLSVVEDYLAAAPGDHAVRATAVRLLIDKGLVSVAAELAGQAPADGPDGAELRRAADRLQQVSSDRIDPARTEPQWRANLEALATRDASGRRLAEAVARAWDEIADEIALHRASDGNFLARTTRSDGRRIWVPAALDFAGKLEVLSDPEAWRNLLVPPILVRGVGMGWLLPRLWEATNRTFLTYSPALHVVEPNLRALAVVLRLHDWRVLLADPRVYLFAGPAAWEQWKQRLRDDPMLAVPTQVCAQMAWPGMPPSTWEEAYREAVVQRDTADARLREEVEAVYDKRTPAWWAERYRSAGPDDPLRVLLVTSRYTTFLQHATRDLKRAFDKAGLRTRMLVEPHDHALLARRTYLQAFVEFVPDLVVVIDHHRQEYPDRYPAHVPYVCWIQDELPELFDSKVGRNLGPLDFVIGYGRTECVLKHGYPADGFLACRVPVDVDKFDVGAEEPVDESLVCDVAYVSHHSESPEALHARVRAMADQPALVKLIDAFYERTRDLMASTRFNAAWDLDRLLSEVEEQTRLHCTNAAARQRVMSVFVRPLADRMLRHTTLSWVADWADATGRRLHLYGRGWEEHRRFGRYARGPADHGAHLARIARHATVNLHVGLAPALHQRVLETVAAGGLVLVRYNPNDFYPEAMDVFRRYLAEQGVDRPTTIPNDHLPAEFVEMRRRRFEETGRPLPEAVEVTEAFLLQQDPRRQDDFADEYASRAFRDFESITFRDAAGFAERAEFFMAHPDRRRAVIAAMREVVVRRFSYDALVARLVAFLRDRLVRYAGG